MDRSYESFESMTVPKELSATQVTSFPVNLPSHGALKVDKNLPTFLYTYYNMDPTWHQGIDGNRILLLEPSFFEQYPVSDKCLDFLLKLGENIPGIQVYVGSFDELINEYGFSNCVFKEHPLTKHFQGISEPRDWICPEVLGYYPSFFAYWKQVKKQLTTNLPTV
jgi:deoxyribodipyrimidine photo-lyase